VDGYDSNPIQTQVLDRKTCISEAFENEFTDQNNQHGFNILLQSRALSIRYLPKKKSQF